MGKMNYEKLIRAISAEVTHKVAGQLSPTLDVRADDCGDSHGYDCGQGVKFKCNSGDFDCGTQGFSCEKFTG